VEAQAQSQGGIFCGQRGTGVGFLSVFWFFSANYIPPHSLINNQWLAKRPICSCSAKYSTLPHPKNKKEKCSHMQCMSLKILFIEELQTQMAIL
jgi:hypothetical protein